MALRVLLVLASTLAAFWADDVGLARAATATDQGLLSAGSRFPLSVQPGYRYLLDASGRPFLVQGDAAWSLIAELRNDEVIQYLDDRRARGFNAILVSLIEHRFASNPPANAYGDVPFLVAGDYGAPNDAYFAHAEWVVQEAAKRDILVLLTPSYLGFGGGEEGWYGEMVANGVDKLRTYGRYLSKRFRAHPNVLWVQAGDFDPPNKDVVRALAEGIRSDDPRALQTAHGGPEGTALSYWRGGEPWLQVDTVYSYKHVYDSLAKAYVAPEQLPFFLIESYYENEAGVTEQDLRAQAYAAALSGGGGQVFGNNPIWHFSGAGLYPAPYTWQEALGSSGSRDMSYLEELLSALPWWKLRPDLSEKFLRSDGRGGDGRAVAATAADGSFAIVYVPDRRAISVDLDQLTGPSVRARWFDPSAGSFSAPLREGLRAAGIYSFIPNGENQSSFDDWVLLLESTS